MEATRVKHVVRQQKTEEYRKQVLGSMAALSICTDMEPDHMKEYMVTYVKQQFEQIEADYEHSFWKAHVRARDRLSFV